MKLIDGTSCGLLERHVAWQQTGLPGPQGPVGPQGPAGPSGGDKVFLGSESFATINIPNQTSTEEYTFATSRTFTALAQGKCNLALTAFISDDSLPRLEVYPAYLRDQATWTRLAERAELTGFGDGLQQGSTVIGIPIDAGVSYTFGVAIKAYDVPTPAAFGKAAITWTCKYD
jgi:hypothetical protein